MSRRRGKPCPLGGQNAVGYCRLHKVTVTPKQMKKRKCLEKECRHFVRLERHPLWEQKRRAKELRNERKKTTEQIGVESDEEQES